MWEWSDRMMTTMPSRTSRNCVKTGPATSISACRQMAIAVMLWGEACDRSKICIFMITPRSERHKVIFYLIFSSFLLAKMTIKVKNKLPAYIWNDIWDESDSAFMWTINIESFFYPFRSFATYASMMIFLFLNNFPSFIPNFSRRDASIQFLVLSFDEFCKRSINH